MQNIIYLKIQILQKMIPCMLRWNLVFMMTPHHLAHWLFWKQNVQNIVVGDIDRDERTNGKGIELLKNQRFKYIYRKWCK